MPFRKLAMIVTIGMCTTAAVARAGSAPLPTTPPPVIAQAEPAPLPAPALPPPHVRAWQTGVVRSDRLQHAAFAFTTGVMVGLTSEEPVAAFGAAMTLGLAKELWDGRHGHFDAVDLLADALGAAGAAAATITLTR